MASSDEKSSISKSELSSFILPDDIILNIASFLDATELCSLGSCSRYLRDLCASDCLWIVLFKRRWPSLRLDSSGNPVEEPEGGGGGSSSSSSYAVQGWKKIYTRRHEEIAGRVSAVIDYVNLCSQNGSLEVGDYLKAIKDFGSMQPEFEDVKLFIFKVKQNVLMNLIVLHYSMFHLGIPGNDINEALCSSQLSRREVCVFYFRLGRWLFGFRLPDDRSSRLVSLSELTMPKEKELCSILNRGAVHEVLRVQITPAATGCVQAALDHHNSRQQIH